MPLLPLNHRMLDPPENSRNEDHPLSVSMTPQVNNISFPCRIIQLTPVKQSHQILTTNLPSNLTHLSFN